MTLPPLIKHPQRRCADCCGDTWDLVYKYSAIERELAIAARLKELDDLLFTIVFQQMTQKEQLALLPLKNKIVHLINELETK